MIHLSISIEEMAQHKRSLKRTTEGNHKSGWLALQNVQPTFIANHCSCMSYKTLKTMSVYTQLVGDIYNTTLSYSPSLDIIVFIL